MGGLWGFEAPRRASTCSSLPTSATWTGLGVVGPMQPTELRPNIHTWLQTRSCSARFTQFNLSALHPLLPQAGAATPRPRLARYAPPCTSVPHRAPLSSEVGELLAAGVLCAALVLHALCFRPASELLLCALARSSPQGGCLRSHSGRGLLVHACSPGASLMQNTKPASCFSPWCMPLALCTLQHTLSASARPLATPCGDDVHRHVTLCSTRWQLRLTRPHSSAARAQSTDEHWAPSLYVHPELCLGRHPLWHCSNEPSPSGFKAPLQQRRQQRRLASRQQSVAGIV